MSALGPLRPLVINRLILAGIILLLFIHGLSLLQLCVCGGVVLLSDFGVLPIIADRKLSSTHYIVYRQVSREWCSSWLSNRPAEEEM